MVSNSLAQFGEKCLDREQDIKLPLQFINGSWVQPHKIDDVNSDENFCDKCVFQPPDLCASCTEACGASQREDGLEVYFTLAESDPNGKAANEAGAKLDAGKNRLGLVLLEFARALTAVGEVGTYGANKYTDNGWIDVPNGQARYTDAMLRHLMKEAKGERDDPDTGLRHAAHAAWNALARLDLALREYEGKI